MKICEIEGYIRGFEYDYERGFLFNGTWFVDDGFRCHEEEIIFPFNVNRPDKIELETIRNKKFRLTIEICEDEEFEEGIKNAIQEKASMTLKHAMDLNPFKI